ncbi:MAG TPA: SBBP repeat-containing protein, partial [Ignavibacteria bacterium]
MKNIIYLFTFITILLSNILIAQPVNLDWSIKYESSSNDTNMVYGMKVDQSGNIFVISNIKSAETKNDFLTVKYNSSGIKLWENRYNGLANDDDYVSKIALDKTGNIYVTATTIEESGLKYTTTIKYNTDGNMIWNAKKQASGWVMGIYIDDNNYIFILTSNDLIKYNSEGKEQSVIPLNSTSHITAADFAIDRNEYIYVVGEIRVAEKNTDYMICKYDSKGNLLWSRQYDGKPNLSYSWDRAEFIRIDSNSNIFVTGQSIGTNTGWDIVSLKYDSFGNQLWFDRFMGTDVSALSQNQDLPQKLIMDKNGDVLICGESGNKNPSYDFTVLKYSSSGKLLWSRIIDNGWAYDITSDENNDVYVSGDISFDIENQKFESIIIKYSSNGELLWRELFKINDKGNYWHKICLDNNKNVIVSGVFKSDDSPPNFFIRKYSQALDDNTYKSILLDARKAFDGNNFLRVVELLKDFPIENPSYPQAVELMKKAIANLPNNSTQNFVTVSGSINCGCSKAISGYVVFEDMNTRLSVGKCRITSDGYYCIVLPSGKIYSYYIDSKDFYPVSRVIDFTTTNQSPNYRDNINIVTYEDMKEKQTSVRINNIFFDFNESKLKSESYLELDRL